jgi:hypothetical protein
LRERIEVRVFCPLSLRERVRVREDGHGEV